LVGRADLNGKRGIVISYVDEKGRCATQFGSESVLVKPSNLKVADDEPADTEEALIAAVLRLRLENTQLNAEQLHTALVAEGWRDLSLGEAKKAASKATKRHPPAYAAATETAPSVAAATAMPFEVGSVVTHLDGSKLEVLKSKADGMVVALTTNRQQLELPQEQLVLLDTPRNTCPTGYDLVVQSPSIGRIDRCDTLA